MSGITDAITSALPCLHTYTTHTLPVPLPTWQHDDGIVPGITDAITKTIGDRKNPNGCTIPLTWCVARMGGL